MRNYFFFAAGFFAAGFFADGFLVGLIGGLLVGLLGLAICFYDILLGFGAGRGGGGTGFGRGGTGTFLVGVVGRGFDGFGGADIYS